VELPAVAVRVTSVLVATAVVVTLKIALVAPGCTMTFAGTVAAALELESETTVPPAGAA